MSIKLKYILNFLLFFFLISLTPVSYAQTQPTQTPFTQIDPNQPEEQVTSLSDMALDELTKSHSSGARNPFAPGVVQEEFDPTALMIEGIIIGPRTKISMISRQIVSTGDRLGNYTVQKIKPGRVVLSQLEDEYVVRMENYSPHVKVRLPSKFYVEFYNADLKQALKVLAKAGNINMIIPESISGKVTISFNNTKIIDVIASILRVNDLEYATENNIMRIGKADQFKDGSDLKALSVPLKYATAKEMQDMIKTFLSERGKTISDERTNTVIVKDHANVIDNVVKFLASVDRKDPQVSIEAKIIDATSSFSRSLGIQWGLTSGPNNAVVRGNTDVGNISSSPHTGSIVNLPASSPTSGLDILVGRLPGNTSLQAQLSAAESTGLIRIISKPNVTTINNKTAKIRSGLKIYVKVDSGTDEGPQLQEIDTGIELNVTPQITINRMIKMSIEAIESEADFSRTVDGMPVIIDNTATTTVLIPDGETAVIGGLLKVKSNKQKNSVPGISKVPVLGWLFKNSSVAKDSTELMIFITPKILDETYYKISHDLSNKPKIKY